MPFARNKILINFDACVGTWKLIKAKYKSLKRLAKEIQKMTGQDGKSLITKTGDFRDRMQALCDEKWKADMKYVDGLSQLEKDMAAFADQHS